MEKLYQNIYYMALCLMCDNYHFVNDMQNDVVFYDMAKAQNESAVINAEILKYLNNHAISIHLIKNLVVLKSKLLDCFAFI